MSVGKSNLIPTGHKAQDIVIEARRVTAAFWSVAVYDHCDRNPDSVNSPPWQ
jgi:uncharacterized membrane protein